MHKNLISAFLIMIIMSAQKADGQIGSSQFYSEANGTIDGVEKVNALSIRTQNKTDNFFTALQKQFGKPTTSKSIMGPIFRFKGPNKLWGEYDIRIRITLLVETDLQNHRSKTMFIFVGNTSQNDLLIPGTQLSKAISSYFQDLFKKTIENGVADQALMGN